MGIHLIPIPINLVLITLYLLARNLHDAKTSLKRTAGCEAGDGRT